MQRQFETPEPIGLHIEIGKGQVSIHATATGTTDVRVEGQEADDVEVAFEGNNLSIIGPKRSGGFFGKDHDLDVEVTLPTDSQVSVKTGSADIEVDGQVAEGRLRRRHL